MMYEVVEIISRKTKRFGVRFFGSDKEASEYLANKREWNAGNKQYSIVALKLVDSPAYKDLSALGYTEETF